MHFRRLSPERTVVLPHKYMKRSLTTPATPMSKHTYALRAEERRSMHKAQIYSATHSTKWTAEKGQYSPRQLLTTTTRKKYYYTTATTIKYYYY